MERTLVSAREATNWPLMVLPVRTSMNALPMEPQFVHLPTTSNVTTLHPGTDVLASQISTSNSKPTGVLMLMSAPQELTRVLPTPTAPTKSEVMTAAVTLGTHQMVWVVVSTSMNVLEEQTCVTRRSVYALTTKEDIHVAVRLDMKAMV